MRRWPSWSNYVPRGMGDYDPRYPAEAYATCEACGTEIVCDLADYPPDEDAHRAASTGCVTPPDSTVPRTGTPRRSFWTDEPLLDGEYCCPECGAITSEPSGLCERCAEEDS